MVFPSPTARLSAISLSEPVSLAAPDIEMDATSDAPMISRVKLRVSPSGLLFLSESDTFRVYADFDISFTLSAWPTQSIFSTVTSTSSTASTRSLDS